MGFVRTAVVVDDHVGFRAQARRLLERAGYRVIGEASDGASALTLAGDVHPDVAFAVTGEVIQARSGGTQNVIIEFLGGYSFAVAGLIAWRRRPENHLGRLMVIVSVAWFIGSYQDAHVDVLQSLAIAFGAFEAIAISHVALAYPDGRLSGRAERVAIVAGYAFAGIASLTVLLTFNPRRDVRCDCPSAPLGLFSNPPLLRFAYDNTDKIAGAVVLVAVILLVRRLRSANVTERWLLAPLWIVAAVAGTTFVVRTTVNFVPSATLPLGGSMTC